MQRNRPGFKEINLYFARFLRSHIFEYLDLIFLELYLKPATLLGSVKNPGECFSETARSGNFKLFLNIFLVTIYCKIEMQFEEHLHLILISLCLVHPVFNLLKRLKSF